MTELERTLRDAAIWQRRAAMCHEDAIGARTVGARESEIVHAELRETAARLARTLLLSAISHRKPE